MPSRNKSDQAAMKELAGYYERRASEYDRVYQKLEQQNDFEKLRYWLADQVKAKRVLEVACGTGYWTAVAASTAQKIIATDINTRPIKIAAAKPVQCSVEFLQADAFDLPEFMEHFDCGMAHFWLSHIPKSMLERFMKHFASRLAPNSNLLFIDSKYVSGYRKPPARHDAEGNAYDLRKLANGSTHEIVKNYLGEEDVRRLLGSICGDIQFAEFDYLWAVKATLL